MMERLLLYIAYFLYMILQYFGHANVKGLHQLCVPLGLECYHQTTEPSSETYIHYIFQRKS